MIDVGVLFQVPSVVVCVEPTRTVPDTTGVTVLYGAPTFLVEAEYAVPAPVVEVIVTTDLTYLPESSLVNVYELLVAPEISDQLDASVDRCHLYAYVPDADHVPDEVEIAVPTVQEPLRTGAKVFVITRPVTAVVADEYTTSE